MVMASPFISIVNLVSVFSFGLMMITSLAVPGGCGCLIWHLPVQKHGSGKQGQAVQECRLLLKCIVSYHNEFK